MFQGKLPVPPLGKQLIAPCSGHSSGAGRHSRRLAADPACCRSLTRA